MVAPRATTKKKAKSSGLIFEAADGKPCTIAEVGWCGCCAAEAQVTSISATYRATPIVADSALRDEQTIDAITGNQPKEV